MAPKLTWQVCVVIASIQGRSILDVWHIMQHSYAHKCHLPASHNWFRLHHKQKLHSKEAKDP